MKAKIERIEKELAEIKAQLNKPEPPFWGWFIGNIARCYKVDPDGYYCDNHSDSIYNGCYWSKQYFKRLATPKEVEKHLTELFCQKYKDGDIFMSIETRKAVIVRSSTSFKYIPQLDILYHRGMMVYEDGKWAEKVNKNQKHATNILNQIMSHIGVEGIGNEAEFVAIIKEYLDKNFKP